MLFDIKIKLEYKDKVVKGSILIITKSDDLAYYICIE